MDHLSLLFLSVEKVFPPKDEFQCLRGKRDTGDVRALPLGKQNGDSVFSGSPVMISPENKDYMTTTETERKIPT